MKNVILRVLVLILEFGFTSTLLAQIYYPKPPTVIGAEEVVFDWTTDRCEDLDIPDAPARAFRDADGNVQLIASHYVNRRMIGATLDAVEMDCDIIMNSDFDSDPSKYNNKEWIRGVYTQDGETIHAIIHNEHIPCGVWTGCWYNTLTYATSVDGGQTYTQDVAPNHFLAGAPYQYSSGSPMGVFGGSSPVFNPNDNYYYMMVHLESHLLQNWGAGVLRTQTLSDPNSWRGWDGEGFNVTFVDPYNEIVASPEEHILAPVSRDYIGKISSSLTYNTYFERFMVVGKDWSSGGFIYSLSDDLIHWSPKVSLYPGPINSAGEIETGWTAGGILYPEIIDPSDTTRNFENPGQDPYLYFTKWNQASSSLDRDLVRVQVHFSTDSLVVTEFTVNSVGDELDNNLGDGILTTGNTLDSGENEKTLRAAIVESNNRPNGFDYPLIINFDIPGDGVHTIELDDYLADIEMPVIINGYSQPGAVQNTNDFEDGLNFELKIEIDASNTGGGGVLQVKAANCTIKGMILNGGPFNIDYEEVFSSTAGYCTVQGNIIGYDATATVSAGGSIRINDCDYNQIGGVNPEDRNLIAGLRIENSSNNVIQGNYFGTDMTGSAGLIGGGSNLLDLEGTSELNQIGGVDDNTGNVFAGSNLNAAVAFYGEQVRNNYFYGNKIGVNVSASQAIGAFNYGVRLSNYANNNHIGAMGGGNVIASAAAGVASVLIETYAHDNNFIANSVGSDLSGTLNFNSQGPAIQITNDAYSNRIGGFEESEGNIIAYNQGKGVQITNTAGIGNEIYQNSIHSNLYLGIDIGDGGPNTNDLIDNDTGPNNLQNYPIISSALFENDTVTLHGTFNSVASSTFRLEYYLNDECDPSGYGEGERYLGSGYVSTDVDGSAEFSISFNVLVPVGSYITATATNPEGSTSEFSACQAITNEELQPSIIVSSHEFEFSFTEDGGGLSGTQNFTISNNGIDNLEWTSTSSQSWLSIEPDNGTVESESPTTIGLTVDVNNIDFGTYAEIITINSNDPSHATTSILVSINYDESGDESSQPTISISNESLQFNFTEGLTPIESQNIVISNGGVNNLEWTSISSQSWIWLEPNQGTIVMDSPSTISLTVDGSAIDFGTYNETIQINSNDPNNPLMTIDVAVTYEAVSDGEAVIAVDLSDLSISMELGQGNANTQFTISNGGDGQLECTITSDMPSTWIMSTPSVTTLAPGASQVITVQVTNNGWSQGVYTGDVIVLSNDLNTPEITIPLTVTVGDQDLGPSIIISNSTFQFNLTNTETLVDTQTFSISNVGIENLDWTSICSQSWISLEPEFGTTETGVPTIISLIVDATMVDFGTHNELISLSSNDQDTPGILIPLTITVIDGLSIDEFLSSNISFFENSPNPFSQSTTFNYTLHQRAYIELIIYDMMGREIRHLINMVSELGEKSIVWDTKNDNGQPVSSGIYFSKLRSNKDELSIQLLIIK